MATSEILNLAPQAVWKHFYELTRIPRPTGQMEEVTKFIIDFGRSLNLETRQDNAGNVLIRKPASKGTKTERPLLSSRTWIWFRRKMPMLCTISPKIRSALYRW